MHIQLQLVKVELMLTILFTPVVWKHFKSYLNKCSEEKYRKIFFTADEGTVL